MDRRARTYEPGAAVMLLMVLLGLGSLSVPRSAVAATYYASPGGGGNCSQGSPCSLTTGLGQLSCGDTLYLREGTYNNHLIIDNYGCSSYDNAVTLASAPGETATILGSIIARSNYTIYDRLIVDGPDVQNTISFVGAEGQYQRFQNGEVRNASQNGSVPCSQTDNNTFWGPNIFIGGTGHIEILHSRLHHSRCSYAIYFSGAYDVLIDDVEMDHNFGYGFQIYTGDYCATCGQHVIRNSYIHDNGFGRGQAGCIIRGADNNLLYNNIFANNFNEGIDIGFNATNTHVYNNVVYGQQVGPGILVGGTEGTIVSNNIVWNNGGGEISGAGGTQLNNTTTNPSFVNAGNGQFQLQPGSNSLGNGMNLSAIFTTDKDGNPRPATGTWDRGPYQSGGSTQLPAPTNLRLISQTP